MRDTILIALASLLIGFCFMMPAQAESPVYYATDPTNITGDVTITGDLTVTGVINGDGSQISNIASFDFNSIGNASATQPVNWSLGTIQNTVLVANTTFSFNNASSGILTLILYQDSSGNRTATWPGTVMWEYGTAPTISNAANAIDMVQFIYDGSTYFGSILFELD